MNSLTSIILAFLTIGLISGFFAFYIKNTYSPKNIKRNRKAYFSEKQ